MLTSHRMYCETERKTIKYDVHMVLSCRIKYDVNMVLSCRKNEAKRLSHFIFASMDVYPYPKNQYHWAIQSWHIADSIFGIAFGIHTWTWPHQHARTESSRCIYVRLTTCKKSYFYLSSFFRYNRAVILDHFGAHVWPHQLDWEKLQLLWIPNFL